MKDLDGEQKLLLIGFVCAFAWADLELHPKERKAVLSLVNRLAIDEAGRAQVMRWLRSPPVDELDPHAIPREARAEFLAECEAIIRADGVVHPEESETMNLLTAVLFGDAAAARRRLALAAKGAAKGGKKKGAEKVGADRDGHHHRENEREDHTMAAKKNGATTAKAGGVKAGKQAVVEHLNKILQMELAGVSRYLHYSFMVFGPNRIPIVSFFRAQATEGMTHAIAMGEKITAYGGHPTIRVENPPESGKHDVRSLLQESLDFERSGVGLYRQLLDMADGDIALEELTRAQVRAETEHCEEVEKMLREFGG